MKKPLLILAFLVAAHVVLYVATVVNDRKPSPTVHVTQARPPAEIAIPPVVEPAISNPALAQAFRNRTSNLQVQGYGIVERVLPDDNEGSRHQRILVDVGAGQTILIAHNIDIAPRIPSIREGDTIEFYGVYEWKPEGGTVHWTHHDPSRRYQGGWLQHNGRAYQ